MVIVIYRIYHCNHFSVVDNFITDVLLSLFNETVECIFRNLETINVSSNDSISAFISHVIDKAVFLIKNRVF